jgi:hypothetical protein
MTETEAVKLVLAKRRELRIPAAMQPASAEKSIVEYAKDRSRPGPVENRIAWIVTLLSSTGYVNVHVDDRTGEVLDVRRSA